MFCCCGNFNNPFMLMNNMFMANMLMPNTFMPNYSSGFFMPNMFNSFMNPMFMNPMLQFPSIMNPSIFNFGNYQNNNTLWNFNTISPPIVNHTPARAPVKHAPKRVSPSKVKKELGPEFLTRVKQIARNLNCNYKDLLGVMNAESGLNSKAVNPNGGATGLIQFMPATAKELGTTTQKLKNMSPLEQLDYVEKYLLKNKNTAGFKPNQKLNAGDLYALVFLPGRAQREVLTDSSEKYYKYNKGLDLNKDGKITKSELAQKVQRKHVNESIFA